MATTTPDNIWTPDSGDDYALTVDLAATADTVQAALTDIRTKSPSRVGTNAQRLALSGASLFEGLTFRTTDTDLTWFYTGTAWVISENGMYLIPPTTVSGGTITNGKTVLSSGDTVTINGVFSTRFRRYKIIASFVLSGALNRSIMRLTAAGAPVTTNYDSQSIVGNGTSVAGAFASADTAFNMMGAIGSSHAGEFNLYNPGNPEPTLLDSRAITRPSGVSIFGSAHTLATAYDGVRIELVTKAAGNAFTSGEIAVYGLA